MDVVHIGDVEVAEVIRVGVTRVDTGAAVEGGIENWKFC